VVAAQVDAVLLPVASWWLLTTLLGLAAAPLAYRLFPALFDRGLSLARPLGLLLAAYLFWLGAALGLAPPQRGAAVLAVAVLVLAGLLTLGGREQVLLLRHWLAQRWQLLVAGELLFAGAFLLWATVRAYNPEIAGTEKPMELLFLNAVLRAERFPPVDPWLAGHPVSYYYFGYVIVGMLAKLADTPAALAFNLALALLFALTAHGAFGLAATLVAARQPTVTPRTLILTGLGGTWLLVAFGNLVGILDFALSRGWGSPQFWQALAIEGLTTPYHAPSWYPSQHWWWWKATRVINTFQNGQGVDYTITEFPAFSFILGDLHPHVLALPFVLLVLALAANAFFTTDPWGFRWLRDHPGQALLLPLLVGALGFLNSWDLPSYAFVFFAAVALAAYRKAGQFDRWLLRDVGLFALLVGAASVLAYLPFYLFFSSQAAGVRPVTGVGTQLHHYLLFWGPLVFLALGLLISRLAGGLGQDWRTSLQLAGTLGLLPILAWLAATIPAAARAGTLGAFLTALPGRLGLSLLLAALVTAAALVALATRQRADAFVGLLVGTAFLLQLGAEHFFILDVFGSRMNTVFKLSYQAWVLLALAGAYALWVLLPRSGRQLGQLAFSLGAGLLLLAGSYYGLAATWSKTDGFRGQPTLDGLAFARAANPDDTAAIAWLAANTRGQPVILEATGPQYSEFGRVAVQTGLPTLLGWGGHEVQWRGSDALFRGREQEIDRVYLGSREEALAILRKYHVRYVFAGSLERQKYGPAVTERLSSFLDVAFQHGTTTVFRVL
jgi:YYY domain-containing protein